MSALEPGRIRARDLGRRFTIAAQGGRSLKATVLRREHARPQEFWAVRHVDLSIAPGEAFGIVGRNGSGKSTLLKMLARIFGPSEGDCAVGGRLSSLLELGAGFHPEFSAIENIYLSAAIYGIPRDEVARDIESIIDFAELDAFKDQPVKTFSSGMFARLGFSVAMHVRPDVLLLDEVLAVGDESFVQKCMARIADYRRDGGTMVLVTHDAATVERVCDRALLLDHGRPVLTDTAPAVIREYHRRLTLEASAGSTPEADAAAPANGERRGASARVRVVGPDLLERSSFVDGEPLRIEVAVEDAGIAAAQITVTITDETDRPLAAARADTVPAAPDGSIRTAFELPIPPFRAGTYGIDLRVLDTGTGRPVVHSDRAATIAFLPEDPTESGLIRLRGAWTAADADAREARPATDAGTPTERALAEAQRDLAAARREATLMADEAAELRLELGVLQDQVIPIYMQAQAQQRTLDDILTSPTWRLAEGLKAPLRAVGILTHPRARLQEGDFLEEAPELASGSVPMDEVRIVRGSAEPLAGASVAVIAAYDVRRRYGVAVEHMVRALADAGWRTVVSYSTAVEDASLTPDRHLPDVLISRDHAGAGYDFFSWRVALETCPELREARHLLMLNDSVIGPIGPIGPLLARLEESRADVIGLAESGDPMPHIQSWGVAFSERAIAAGAVHDFYGRPGLDWSKDDIIAGLEIPLGVWFARREYVVEVICSPVSLGGERRNPSIFGWQNMIRAGVPLVKRELFTKPDETIGRRPVQVLRAAQRMADVEVDPLVRDSVASVGATIEIG